MKRRDFLTLLGVGGVGAALVVATTQANDLPECDVTSIDEAIDEYREDDGAVYINHESGILHVQRDGRWVPVCRSDDFILSTQEATLKTRDYYTLTIPRGTS